MTVSHYFFGALLIISISACSSSKKDLGTTDIITKAVQPAIITEKVLNDSDDPAIWINPADASKSLVLGTDKGDTTGGIYVFDLQGKIDRKKTVLHLQRPNNIDIEYGFDYKGKKIDIAVFTERGRQMIRVYSLPDMQAIDGGGIKVFVGDSLRDPMGIGLYKKASDIYAIVGRKLGPDGSFLWQYKLYADANGVVQAKKVRAFGKFSGKKEIESIVVDDALGYVYYSDETVGVRQFYASPDSSGKELSLFATAGVKNDHEGLSVYPTSEKTGYILLSDQQANRFHIFSREGAAGQPYSHKLLKIVKVAAIDSDGSDVTAIPLNETFKHGLFVVMSTDKTFHYYRWEDVAGKTLIADTKLVKN
ncbi:3-phytase [Sphingobacteriaceae bacterium]|nr:3-phytase [Sphingobacteriaceae bacterium]